MSPEFFFKDNVTFAEGSQPASCLSYKKVAASAGVLNSCQSLVGKRRLNWYPAALSWILTRAEMALFLATLACKCESPRPCRPFSHASCMIRCFIWKWCMKSRGVPSCLLWMGGRHQDWGAPPGRIQWKGWLVGFSSLCMVVTWVLHFLDQFSRSCTFDCGCCGRLAHYVTKYHGHKLRSHLEKGVHHA